MNVYIWENTAPVSDSWHNNGGLLVIADSLDEARILAGDHIGKFLSQRKLEELVTAEWLTAEADHVLESVPQLSFNEEVPKVIVFPDAGCC